MLISVYCVNDPLTTVLVNPPGGIFHIDGLQQPAFQFYPASTGIGFHMFDYTYSDSFGCPNTYTQTVHVDACLSVTENEKSGGKLYPVPSKNYLLIKTDGDVSFYDLQGKQLEINVSRNGENCVADVDRLSAGFYLCRVNSPIGATVYKWIKE
jgi:Secretion system C-terminal sorting domain